MVHKDLLNTPTFNAVVEMLESENVKIFTGPALHKAIKFAPPQAKSLNHEYCDLAVTIELVDGLDSAVQHINKYGSHHTDSIITQNGNYLIIYCV